MPRRFLNRWTLWLLPLIVLRAFVPMGFMLSAAEHGIEIVMCSGTGPLPDFNDAQSLTAHHHSGHHSDHGKPSGQGDATDGTSCSYALAGFACAGAIWQAPAAPQLAAQKIDFYSDLTRSAEPFLPDRIRGPPFA